MTILNVAGYRFIPLTDLVTLQNTLRTLAQSCDLMGTLLLSEEGINISLAGQEEAVTRFITTLNDDERFRDMAFHRTLSDTVPFKQLKVKIKKEIITFNQPSVDVNQKRAPSISPNLLKHWLDSKRAITLIDTRNEDEIKAGAFEQAVDLHIHQFTELPHAVEHICKSKPVVMYCTGGIRCEKAAIYMLKNGFNEVYQLDGGILGYFAHIGGAHYRGNCFVFDERGAVTPSLTTASHEANATAIA